MTPQTYERTYGQSITIDVCDGCQGIWFDDLEMLHMAPGATLALFRHIQEVANTARHPLASSLGCPRCHLALAQAHDMQRNTRFTYFRCPAGHGRFTTYFQFLRAKNFVRSLTAKEITELRRHIRQINCANCGGPVDINGDTACPFCRTPVSMLDPDQMRAVALELQRAETQRSVDPSFPLQMLAERLRVERSMGGSGMEESLLTVLGRRGNGNLIDAGLGILGAIFRSGA